MVFKNNNIRYFLLIKFKLENNILMIQVQSHFFYEWLEEHYITLLKKVIKKELGNEGRLEYSIVMENSAKNSTPYTVKLPTSDRKVLKNAPVNMPLNVSENQIRNPFIIPGLKRKSCDVCAKRQWCAIHIFTCAVNQSYIVLKLDGLGTIRL